MKEGEQLSAIRPSYSCMDLKKEAKARRRQQTMAGQVSVIRTVLGNLLG